MRIGLFLGLLALGSALLATYLNGLRDANAVNPDWWLVIGMVGGGCVLTGFVIIVPAAIWTWCNRFRLRSPIFRQDLPDPNHWLFDLAEQQRRDPRPQLVITDRIIMGVHLNANRPRLRVKVRFANHSVHHLTVSQPVGYPYFGNEKSEYDIRDEGGHHTVPAGNTATSFDLDIYIPAEFLDRVREEVESASGEVRSISLRYLRTMVQASTEGSPIVSWSIGGDLEIFRRNG
jgi:hypothetical protein